MTEQKKTGIVMTANGWSLYNDAGVLLGRIWSEGSDFAGVYLGNGPDAIVHFEADADFDIICEAIYEED